MSTTEANASGKSPRTARAEASVWIVRLHGEERTPELEAGLREWLAADPENARQFEHATDVWELGGSVSAAGLPRMRAWNTPISGARRVAAAAATICAVAMLAIWWWVGAAYVTAHGEQRLVYLDDGSRVYLNSDSRLRVEFTASERRIRLQRGEGFFEVAKDATRPFIVEVGDREVKALGTTFIVRHELERTAITLVEGKVTVAPIASELQPAPPHESSATGGARVAEAFTLVPGERLILAKLAPPTLDAPRLEALTAWRRGEVLLDATPLEEAIAEMNRYDKRQLYIDDAQLALVRVSGIYRTGDSLGFAQAVAELNGFEVHDVADEIHLRRRPASQ